MTKPAMPSTPRLNDTNALTSQGSMKVTSVNVGRIANGYEVRTSQEDAKGNYNYQETYSEERPHIAITYPAKSEPSSNLSGALSKLSKDRG